MSPWLSTISDLKVTERCVKVMFRYPNRPTETGRRKSGCVVTAQWERPVLRARYPTVVVPRKDCAGRLWELTPRVCRRCGVPAQVVLADRVIPVLIQTANAE